MVEADRALPGRTEPMEIEARHLVLGTRVFFEGHNPTQGMRQGNDAGTQYRSAIYSTSPEQASTAAAVAARFQDSLYEARYGAITTEIARAGPFYYAEPYHQQYLEANPGGYCGLGGTGVSCSVGFPGVG
jgi:peptide-methionine (S)-S-oxide reductase